MRLRDVEQVGRHVDDLARGVNRDRQLPPAVELRNPAGDRLWVGYVGVEGERAYPVHASVAVDVHAHGPLTHEVAGRRRTADAPCCGEVHRPGAHRQITGAEGRNDYGATVGRGVGI